VKLPHPDSCELFYVERDTLFSFHKASEAFLQRVRERGQGFVCLFLRGNRMFDRATSSTQQRRCLPGCSLINCMSVSVSHNPFVKLNARTPAAWRFCLLCTTWS
jgi:hypothetical protein